MGFESTHRQVREELAVELARVHRLELARARELVLQAERLAMSDPDQRSIRQWFQIVLEREARGDDEAEQPGRESLLERLEASRDLRSHGHRADDETVEAAAAAPTPEPLDAAIRARMEAAFGVGFGTVSIVRNSPLARGPIRALATGDAIHFRAGAYRPGTTAGDRLIAHELAHVAQHRGGAGSRPAERADIEREADRAASLASRGMAAPIRLAAQPGTAYAFSDDEHHDHDDHEPATQPGVVAGPDGAPRVSDRWLSALAGSMGQPIPEELRKRLERELKTDLSDVRLHDGPMSDAAAREINARAFTIGKDIHFAQGLYDPRSPKGIELIAHEVAHAVQGGSVTDFKNAAISTPGDSRELEAERFATEFVKQEEARAELAAQRAEAGRRPHVLDGEGNDGSSASEPSTLSRALGPRRPLARGTRGPRLGMSSMVIAGSVNHAIVHRDGGDGPPPPPAAPTKQKPAPKDPGKPDLNEGELKKKKKDANDPEQDKKDKAKYEKDNPNAPKDPEPVPPKAKEPPKVEKPKPNEKKGGDAPPKKKGGKPEKPDLKTPPKGDKPKAPPPKAPPKQGPAEAAVCAGADVDVQKFWKETPKDEAGAKQISDRSAQIWAAAQALGPAGESDNMLAALDPTTAVYNEGFGKSDLGQALNSWDQSKSPYAEFNDRYRSLAINFARVRDFAFNMSNVLGKIGLVLTVVGFILSLFGVGAILVTIGRVINVINIIMDVVAAVCGIALAVVTAAQIKAETDPYKRAKLAKLLISDVNKAASNVVNVILAKSKTVGKIVGKGVRVVAKVVSAIVKPIAKAISRVYQAVSKFFTNLSKAKGFKGKVGKAFLKGEKGVKSLVNKAKTNRNKVLAEVDKKDALKAEKKANKNSKNADDAATKKANEKAEADAAAKKADQAKKDADSAAQQKKTEAGTKKQELEDARTEAKTKKGELEAAKKAEKQAKTDARKAENDARAAEKAQQKSSDAAKQQADAAKESAERAKAADDAAKQATEQRVAAETAEQQAKTAADNAAKAEKQAAEAAAKAREAAENAKKAAGGDAQAAAKAAEDAQKAAADAQKAADDVVAAQKEAQRAKQNADAAARSEKTTADAQKAAQQQADEAARLKKEADAKAADAQRAANEADAAAAKAKADKAKAEQIEAEAKAAADQRARADAAKKAADEAAAKKIEADNAAKKAQEDARAAAEQKTKAEQAAKDRAAAEQKAIEQQKAADAQKTDAANRQKAAEQAAADSKTKAEQAQKVQAEADAKVKADQIEAAKRQTELDQAKAAREQQAAKEASDKAAAEQAKQKAEAAERAKQAADQKLADDTKAAEDKRRIAEQRSQEAAQKQKDVETAKKNKEAADKAASDAKKAASDADKAQRDADDAAAQAKKDQENAAKKQKDADEAAAKAEEAKTKADAEKVKAEQEARAAEQHAKEAEQHAKDTDKWDLDKNKNPMPQTPNRIADDMSADAAKDQAGSYAVGQWQQELATKNDPTDQWGGIGINDARWDLNKPPRRAPRMSELRPSSPRNVNISESVAKIFKKKEDAGGAQTPGTPGPTPGTPTPTPTSTSTPAGGDAKPQKIDAGPLPYWPELVTTYNFDLKAMGEARQQVAAYKTQQQAAVQTARNDLKKRAAEIRAEAQARKAPVKQNEEGLNKDKTNLAESKDGNQKQIDNDKKNEEEKAKSEGPGQEGADAAEQAAAAEPPKPKGWWGRIKAAANWFLKNTLGRAMKFVTDAITNVVLFTIKHSMGLDVKEIANHGMQTADAGTAKAGEGTADTQKAGADNEKLDQDVAQEDMTLGQRIQAGEKNLKDADELEKTIDAQEKALQAEIKACNDFVKQVEEQFAKCRAEAEKQQQQQQQPPEQEEQPAPEGGGEQGSNTQTSAKPEQDPELASQLAEARGLCTSSIETEIASLNALDAKGAGILVSGADGDPAALAEADRLSTQIQNGALKTSVDKLNSLKSRAESASDEDAMVAVAEEIDEVAAEAADNVIDAYVAAEHDVLATPPSQPSANSATG